MLKKIDYANLQLNIPIKTKSPYFFPTQNHKIRHHIDAFRLNHLHNSQENSPKRYNLSNNSPLAQIQFKKQNSQEDTIIHDSYLKLLKPIQLTLQLMAVNNNSILVPSANSTQSNRKFPVRPQLKTTSHSFRSHITKKQKIQTARQQKQQMFNSLYQDSSNLKKYSRNKDAFFDNATAIIKSNLRSKSRERTSRNNKYKQEILKNRKEINTAQNNRWQNIKQLGKKKQNNKLQQLNNNYEQISNKGFGAWTIVNN